jgi:hypothetical protein
MTAKSMSRPRGGVYVTAWAVFACLYLLGIEGTPVRAQSEAMPEAGDRIRVSARGTSGEFVVEDLRSDSLMVRLDAASAAIPIEMSSVFQLEIYQGSTSRVLGALGGGVGGALLGGLWGLPCLTQVHVTCESVPPGHRVAIGVGVGALLGFIAWGGRQRWERVQLTQQPIFADRATATPSHRTSGLNYIAETQLREQRAQEEDAYSLIQRIHPSWLQARSSAGLTGDRSDPVVFLNGTRYGELPALRNFRVGELISLEYIPARDAATQFGTGFGGGVIMVRTTG